MPLCYPFWGRHGTLNPTPGIPYDLVDAVVAWLRANLLASLLPGGIHYGFAGPMPDGSKRPMPYIQVLRVSESRQMHSNGIYIATGLLQVSVFGPPRTGTAQAADAVSTALAYPHLFFQRGRLMYFAEADLRSDKDPDPGPGGGPVYQEMRMFNYTLNSTL